MYKKMEEPSYFTICTTILSVFVVKRNKGCFVTYQGNFKVLVKNEYILDDEGQNN